MGDLGQFNAFSIDGNDVSLSAFDGEVCLIVNVASRCGYTRQYKGLQRLHEAYAEKGLRILAFPCNQFGGQEPGTNAEIAGFCESKYAVGFRMFSKLSVNGNDAHPLFKWLKAQAPGLLGTEGIKWNFTKFLVHRDGQTVTRFGTQTEPAKLRHAIEQALG